MFLRIRRLHKTQLGQVATGLTFEPSKNLEEATLRTVCVEGTEGDALPSGGQPDC
jgi:hypothetical protein